MSRDPSARNLKWSENISKHSTTVPGMGLDWRLVLSHSNGTRMYSEDDDYYSPSMELPKQQHRVENGTGGPLPMLSGNKLMHTGGRTWFRSECVNYKLHWTWVHHQLHQHSLFRNVKRKPGGGWMGECMDLPMGWQQLRWMMTIIFRSASRTSPVCVWLIEGGSQSLAPITIRRFILYVYM